MIIYLINVLSAWLTKTLNELLVVFVHSLDVWECDQKQWSSTERVLHHHRKSLLSLGTDNTKPAPAKRRKNVHKGIGDQLVNHPHYLYPNVRFFNNTILFEIAIFDKCY